jgi:hypothetical protein
MYMGDLFTACFGPNEPSSCNTNIKIIKKSSWVMSGLYTIEVSFLQLITLY